MNLSFYELTQQEKHIFVWIQFIRYELTHWIEHNGAAITIRSKITITSKAV